MYAGVADLHNSDRGRHERHLAADLVSLVQARHKCPPGGRFGQFGPGST